MDAEYQHISQQSTLSWKALEAIAILCFPSDMRQRGHLLIKSGRNTHIDSHAITYARTRLHINIFLVLSDTQSGLSSRYLYTGEKERQNLAFLIGLVGLGSELHPHSTPLYSTGNFQPQFMPLLTLAFSSPTASQSVDQQELF